MLYVPRHLPNKLEYKGLCCISVHYQSRMASNGIAITPSHPPTVQAGQYGESDLSSFKKKLIFFLKNVMHPKKNLRVKKNAGAEEEFRQQFLQRCSL